MKIMVCAVRPDFSPPREWELAEYITAYYQKIGLEADLFALPANNDILDMPEQVAAFRMMEIGSTADIFIAVGCPAFFIQHPNKHVFLFQLLPELFEYWNTPYGVPATYQYTKIKDMVNVAVGRQLHSVKSLFCGSNLLKEDIRKRFGAKAEVFRREQEKPEESIKREKNRAIAMQTWFMPEDRIELAVDAFAHITGRLEMTLFVPDAHPLDCRATQTRIEKAGLCERVRMESRTIAEGDWQTISTLLSIPYETRSVDRSVKDALQRGMPVVTTQDSGAVLEYVRAQNSVAVKPEACEIADGILHAAQLKELKKPWRGGTLEKERAINSVLEGLVK
ncbi:hypothetical protein LJC56_10935 [Christensenellaceae bacterium OttesenSCG-928-K19]|nr:hypothetical protein [Christensenellaceae bacterium OttesenSCG-928-K19]